MCVKSTKILNSKRLSRFLGLVGLNSFHEFVILGGRIEPIPFLVHGHKYEGKSSQESPRKISKQM